jgi:hypothetical protein
MNSFKHKGIHKHTLTALGPRSIIDCFLWNEKLSRLLTDIIVYRGRDVGLDHLLLEAQVKLRARWHKKVKEI